MSAGGCQAHSCGVAVPINDRVTQVWPQRREVKVRSSREVFWWQGASPGHGLCWDIVENFPWKGLPWLPHLHLGSPRLCHPSGWNSHGGREESGWEMELRCLRAGPETLQFLWPRSRVFFLLLLVFVQFPNPELVLWHQAAAFSSSSSSSSSQMLVNHWFISSWP